MFEYDSYIVIVGSYISCEIDKHVQSFAFAIDQRMIDLLMKTWRCPRVNENRRDWIIDTEVVRA